MRQVLALLSRRVRNTARRLGVEYAFHLMRADGGQLAEITKLVQDGSTVPITARTFPFCDVNAALDLLDGGRAKGKIVVAVQ